MPCYRCHYCAQEKHTACESLHAGNYDPGGFSEFIRVPEENVKYGTFLLPDEVTFDDATMIEPLGCIVAGQNQLVFRKGQTVLIIGSGISGLLHISLAKLKGARVIATDIHEYRMNKALEFGADYVINAGKYSVEELRNMNDGRLADIVIVCASAKQAVDNAVSSINRKGTLLFFAIPETDIAVPSMSFWRDEITVTFSYGAEPEDLKEALKLIQSGKVNVRSMITHRVRLSDIQQGFKLVTEAKNSLKVVVVPDDNN
ncbi:MAG: zinc-binding dehydrogenase [Candidatus Mariimomonas ferrooxydans]